MTTTRRPLRRTAGDVIRGITALVTVLLLLLGIPAALTVVAGNPLPGRLPSLDQVTAALTAPDDGTLFLTALTWVGWIGWATFALALLVEVPAQLGGRPTPRLPALGLQQRTAGVLVASIVVLIGAPALVAPLPAHAIVATAPPAAGTTATEPEDAAAPSRTYLVRPGDNLWDIAENRLGDGARYQEIARLNYGTPQPGGGALDSSHQLKPGWVLRLPPHEDTEHADHPDVRQDIDVVTVERGDTLSGIAADHLGDASRYPEIVQATREIVQLDGRRLSDPDLIYPGWQVHLPPNTTATPPTAPPVPAEPPPPAEPIAPQPDEAASNAPNDTRHLDERAHDHQPDPPTPTADSATDSTADVPATTQPVETGADDGDDDDDGATVLGTSAGIGALAAAGLLALVARKRSRRQRQRRPGHRLPPPQPSTAAAEGKLRVVQDPLSVEHLDRALRTLAATLPDTGEPLPPLRMARILRDRLELHLATPSTLPAPFTAVAGDDTLWVLDRDADLMDAATTADVLSPYPALASIGRDMDGGHVLLDLEELGTLAVQAIDDDQRTAILAALTVELATSTWADDLQVTLVGVCPDLPAALGVDRLTHIGDLDRLLTDLDVWARSLRSALAAAGIHGPKGARSARALPDAWTPNIVLLGPEPTETQRERLRHLAAGEPRLPVAVVTTAGTPLGPWALTRRQDGDLATLEPAGLTLRPQSLPAAVYEQVLDVLRTADAPADAPGPTWTVGLYTSEPELDELEPSTIEPDVVPPSVTATDAGNDDDAHHDDATVTPDSQPSPAAPTVRLLGTVEVIGARGVLSAESHRARITETIAFLALHPHRDHFLLDEAIWPGDRVPDGRRNQLISRARRWLGTAEDGATFIPLVNPDGYRLADTVSTDWADFCDLISGSLAHAPTGDLTTALDLVRGQPFAGTNPRRYGWADIDRQEMISAIVDVAHEVSQRAQSSGDATLARRAAATGLLAEPGSELLWRDALRAEWLAGNRAGIEELADRLTVISEELGGDLEPDTLDLLDELLRRRAAHRNTGPALAGSTAHDH